MSYRNLWINSDSTSSLDQYANPGISMLSPTQIFTISELFQSFWAKSVKYDLG